MTLDEALNQIAKLGFDAVEPVIWDVESLRKSQILNIKEELKFLNLETANICCNDNVYVWRGAPVYTNPDEKIRKDMISRLKKAVEIAVEWNCNSVGLWPGSDTFPLKINYWKAWNLFIDTVSKCAKIAEDYGVRILLEYKPECILNNADSILRAIEQIGSENIGVLLDTGHSFVAREDLPTVVEMFGDKLFHIHVDDNPGDWDRDLPPGVIHNFEPFFAKLKETGYKGYISMDVWPYEDPSNEIACGKEYLERVMRSL